MLGRTHTLSLEDDSSQSIWWFQQDQKRSRLFRILTISLIIMPISLKLETSSDSTNSSYQLEGKYCRNMPCRTFFTISTLLARCNSVIASRSIVTWKVNWPEVCAFSQCLRAYSPWRGFSNRWCLYYPTSFFPWCEEYVWTLSGGCAWHWSWWRFRKNRSIQQRHAFLWWLTTTWKGEEARFSEGASPGSFEYYSTCLWANSQWRFGKGQDNQPNRDNPSFVLSEWTEAWLSFSNTWRDLDNSISG